LDWHTFHNEIRTNSDFDGKGAQIYERSPLDDRSKCSAGNSNGGKEQAGSRRLWQVITARQVPLYLALDISIITILSLFDPIVRVALAQMPLWYWPLVYIPFVLLAKFENPNAPLLFNRAARKRTIAASILLVWALLLVVFFFLHTILYYMPLTYRFQLLLPLVSALVPSFMLSLHAGLSEEPLKIFWINAIAWVFQRRVQTDSGRRDLLWVSATISILFWDFLHFVSSRYSLFEFTVTFFVGLLLFMAVLRTRNLVVAIAAHTLFDFFMSYDVLLILAVVFHP
jgi:membrane protease YdiL (CAAX protease family)